MMANQVGHRYDKVCVIRGHHIYKRLWTLVIGEELVLEAQDGIKHDDHAIAATGMKDGYFVIFYVIYIILAKTSSQMASFTVHLISHRNLASIDAKL